MSEHDKNYQQPFYSINASISNCLRYKTIVVISGGVISSYIGNYQRVLYKTLLSASKGV